MEMMIRIEALEAGYGECTVAGPFSMEIERGAILAVLGRNGSGKSTLLRTLAGLQAPLKGKAWIQGVDVHQTTPALLSRKRAVVLSGRQHVIGELSIGELWRMSQPKGTKSDGRMQELAKRFGLGGWTDRKLATLSDGEYQRVMMVRALVQDTPLVLLDEPTAHLDVIHAMETFHLLQQLPQELGVTVVFTTHNIESALRIADRCLLLGQDHQVHTGTPDELVQNGTLAQAFSAPGIRFDPTTRRLEFGQ